jgi:hypothetical protein
MLKLASVVAAIVFSWAGCGKDDCEKVYDMEQKCSAKEKFPDKDLFVMACNAASKADSTKDEIEAAVTCAKEDTCEAFKACGKGRRGKTRAKEITKAIEAGKWKDAWDDCTLMADYYANPEFKAECVKVFTTGAAKLTGEDQKRAMYRCKSGAEIKKVVPELDKACLAMASGQLTAAIDTLRKSRDAGTRDFKTCFEIDRLAEGATGDTAKIAKELCKELEVAEDAKKAIDEAQKNVTAKKADVPFQCQYTGDKLAQLDTEWSKRTLEALYKACYVDLGAVVLDVDPKDAKYVCPFQVKRMKDTIAKHDLATKYPELAASIAKLPKTCAK